MPLIAWFLLLLLLAAPAHSIAQASASSEPAPSGPDRAVADLQADLHALFRTPRGSGVQRSVLVVSLDRGDTLFALNPDLPLAPASNVKLYSTAAALFYLGPDFRYSTYLLADGEVENGVLNGDLVLFGTGDPTLSARMQGTSPAPLEAFADSVRARGIREIRGRIVGDGTFFDNQWTGAAWEDDDRLAWYAAPIDALLVEESMVTVRVWPGARTGDLARIQTEPATQGLRINNQVRTGGATAVRITHGADGLVITGQVRGGTGGVARRVPVADPEQFAATALLAALRNRGITVTDEAITSADGKPAWAAFGAQPDPTRRVALQLLAVHRSLSLADIARVTNHRSHNLFAEALFKTVGRIATGNGSFAGGQHAVRRMLQAAGVDTAVVQLADGSGLSRPNRTTTRATVQLLDWLTRTDVWQPFFASLPAAGTQDGLRRMFGTAAAGNLRAKTGTIRGVSALSGYVTTADGERLAFSIIANGLSSTAEAKQTENTVGARLAGFRRGR